MTVPSIKTKLGDENLRNELEERAATFDVSLYWANHDKELSVAAATAIAQSALAPKKLYNMYEGDSAGRQLSETVASFLARLPPLTTPVDKHGHWIYIANPRSKARPTDADRAGLMERGREILEELGAAKAGIEASTAGKAKSTIGKKLTPLRKQAEADIYAAAKEKGCTSGKWMLFPTADDVNRIWSLVATATANGELGHAAKVAADDGSGNATPRLVCVYTEDFSDMRDVRRVLGRLVDMGLVMKKKKKKGPMGEERGVYYKADAFTDLGIDSKNEWGLRASLYSSRDVLGEDKGKGWGDWEKMDDG